MKNAGAAAGRDARGRKRVVSGMRPTGRLHIGHYFGALQNWVRLQNAVAPTAGQEKSGHGSAVPLQRAGEYECFYFIADWHALTSDYADTSMVAENTVEIATDFLASGIDPEKSTIFLQSAVPEHAELHLLLSMVTPLGWLERVPTYKEALENVANKDLHTYGFLGYPVLQTADIVIYSEEGVPLFVPVGEDQVSHVELSREIVRRFNYHSGFRIEPRLFHEDNRDQLDRILKKFSLFETTKGHQGIVTGSPRPGSITAGSSITAGGDIKAFGDIKAGVKNIGMEAESRIRNRAREDGISNFMAELTALERVFFSYSDKLTEPQVLLTQTPRIPGLDGRKMSKSYGNAITLSETDEEIRKKTKVMVTDPARKRRTDPGNPDVCPVYDWHKLFSAGELGRLEWVRTGCTTAGIGCIECKAAMAENLIRWIAPVRERRVKWENDRAGVKEIIDAGSKRARVEAQKTMERVREAVFGGDSRG